MRKFILPLVALCLLCACEPKQEELPLQVPQVTDSTQYVDLYCAQNNTANTISIGVQKNGETWDIKSGCGPLLANGHMDCLQFRIHDGEAIYNGTLDMTMRHRIVWKTAWKNEGVHITTFNDAKAALAHLLASENQADGIFFAHNYQASTLEAIKGKLNADDQRLLDKYLMQVEAGHVRVFVFNIDDAYLDTLEKLQ